MSTVANEVLSAAEVVAPDAGAVQVASAVMATASDPSPSNLAADIELAMSLVKQLQASLAGSHPTVTKIVKAVIKEMF